MKALEFCKNKINRDCDIKRHKLAAIAFSKSGNIIASAVNRKGAGYISDFSFHAEEYLVKKLHKLRARERFGFIRVLVVRMGRATPWALAKPCNGCRNILNNYGVTEVHYTDSFGRILEMA